MGKASFSRTNDANGEILWKDEVSHGEHFEEGALLHGLVRQVTVTAKTSATLLVFASKEFKLFVDLFQSLRQLLNDSGMRGAMEEMLHCSVWSEELLNCSVQDLMHSTIVTLSESATIAEAVQKLGESSQKVPLLVWR